MMYPHTDLYDLSQILNNNISKDLLEQSLVLLSLGYDPTTLAVSYSVFCILKHIIIDYKGNYIKI